MRSTNMQKWRTSYQKMFSSSAIANDCRDLLTLAAGERGWNDTRESWLARAARRVGMDYSRAYNIFYGRSRRIEAAEYLSLLFAVERLGALNERNQAMAAEINRTLSHLERKPAHEREHLASIESGDDR